MPHLDGKGKKESGSESQDEDSDEEDEPGDDSDDECGDKHEWLESMGLDKEQFPLLNPKAVTPHQRSTSKQLNKVFIISMAKKIFRHGKMFCCACSVSCR